MWSLSPLPAGWFAKALLFGSAQFALMNTLNQACSPCIRAMVIKQGLAESERDGWQVGQGELNAAFDGLSTLTGCIFPLLWGRLYAACLGRNPRLGGVPFAVSSVLYGCSWCSMRCASPKLLLLDDAD